MKKYNHIIKTLALLLDNTKNNDKIEELELLEGVLIKCKKYDNKIKKLENEITFFESQPLAMYYNSKSLNLAKNELHDLRENFEYYKTFYNNLIKEKGYKIKSYLIK